MKQVSKPQQFEAREGAVEQDKLWQVAKRGTGARQLSFGWGDNPAPLPPRASAPWQLGGCTPLPERSLVVLAGHGQAWVLDESLAASKVMLYTAAARLSLPELSCKTVFIHLPGEIPEDFRRDSLAEASRIAWGAIFILSPGVPVDAVGCFETHACFRLRFACRWPVLGEAGSGLRLSVFVVET